MINTPTTSSRPATTQKLLASLHDDRPAALKSLATSPFRITGDPIDAAEFWTLFDELVRADGTIDTSALEPADADVMHFDPVSVGVFIAVCGLVVAAFSAGYAAGKDAADTDDADDEAAAEDDAATDDNAAERASRIKHEQAIMTFAPGRRGTATRVVTTKLAHRPSDIPAKELLADLRNHRAATLKRLRGQRDWRVVTPPMPADVVWAFIDTSVSPNGTIDLATTKLPTSSLFAPAEPAAFTTVEVMVAIALLTLAAGALGFGVGYTVNDNEAPGSADETETDQGEGSGGEGSGGDDSGGDTGDDGGAGAGVVASPILRNGFRNTVDLTFRDIAVSDEG